MADNTEIRVQLESLTKDIENINNIQGRLDTAIDKLTDVSTSIKSMLAVHEEKIQRQEQIDDIIFKKLKDRDSEVDEAAANNANLPFILVEDGYTGKTPKEIKHDYLIKDFINFDKIINNYL